MLYTQEQVREAIMRLTMCARKECEMCQYKDRPESDLPSYDCKKRATKNMNILADVCMCNVKIAKPKAMSGCAKRKETLCWECANNCGKCSWSKDFTPVENWEAVPTKIKEYHNRSSYIESYRVISCPEFERSKRYKR